jgi:hypothetical protein
MLKNMSFIGKKKILREQINNFHSGETFEKEPPVPIKFLQIEQCNPSWQLALVPIKLAASSTEGCSSTTQSFIASASYMI